MVRVVVRSPTRKANPFKRKQEPCKICLRRQTQHFPESLLRVGIPEEPATRGWRTGIVVHLASESTAFSEDETESRGPSAKGKKDHVARREQELSPSETRAIFLLEVDASHLDSDPSYPPKWSLGVRKFVDGIRNRKNYRAAAEVGLPASAAPGTPANKCHNPVSGKTRRSAVRKILGHAESEDGAEVNVADGLYIYEFPRMVEIATQRSSAKENWVWTNGVLILCVYALRCFLELVEA
ncbi:hypothetical protein FB451DRAFT_1178363 [Mycena latifolia]|nr:hypothetical protein FB451DRAFT_1178363 [Mycena latifolia]